jgi:hypothetical protein
MSLVLTRCSPSCSAVPRPLLGAAGDDGGVELTADFLVSHCFQRADELGAVACVGAMAAKTTSDARQSRSIVGASSGG